MFSSRTTRYRSRCSDRVPIATRDRLAGKRPLGTRLACHPIRCRRQLLAPFGVGLDHRLDRHETFTHAGGGEVLDRDRARRGAPGRHCAHSRALAAGYARASRKRIQQEAPAGAERVVGVQVMNLHRGSLSAASCSRHGHRPLYFNPERPYFRLGIRSPRTSRNRPGLPSIRRGRGRFQRGCLRLRPA